MQYLQSNPSYGPERSGACAFWKVFQLLNQSSQLPAIPDDKVSGGGVVAVEISRMHIFYGV